MASPSRPDRLDQTIMGCLAEDARLTFAEIGEEVGLSASAVKRRVDWLVEQKIIGQFTITIDPARIGQRVEAFVEVSTVRQTSAKDLRALVSRHPEVTGAWVVTGEMNALLQVLTLDVDHLEALLEELRAEPKVFTTKTLVVLSRLLERNALRMVDPEP